MRRAGSTVSPARTIHQCLGALATALVPVLIIALFLTKNAFLLLALIADGSVVWRFLAELWAERGRVTRPKRRDVAPLARPKNSNRRKL